MKPCTDHLGNNYSSVKKMCEHFGIAYEVYNARVMRGWSLKDALTVPEGERPKRIDKFNVESNRPSVEYKRCLYYKLNILNKMDSPYIWADQIYEMHKKITEMESLSVWLNDLDDYLLGEKQDQKKREQIESIINNPESIFNDVLKFDKNFHISGYFDKWTP